MKPRHLWKQPKRRPLRPGTAPIARSPIARSTTPLPKRKKRTPAQTAAKFEREYGSQKRVEWVKAQRCLVEEFGISGVCRGRIVNAHVGNEGAGTGRKANADQNAPMCDLHHRILDDEIGPVEFEAQYGVSLAACVAETQRRWAAHVAARGGQ